MKYNYQKRILLNEILKLSNTQGLSKKTIDIASKNIGIPIEKAHILFPNPQKDIIAYWNKTIDIKICYFANNLNHNLKIRDKIYKIIIFRLNLLQNNKALLQNQYINITHSQNINLIRYFYKTASIIWTAINDKSKKNDYNFYSKRIILSIIMINSTIYWLNNNDNSKNNQFIQQQITFILNLQKNQKIKQIKQILKYIPFTNHPLKMRDEK